MRWRVGSDIAPKTAENSPGSYGLKQSHLFIHSHISMHLITLFPPIGHVNPDE